MKDTNAIEKALKKKINEECRVIVDNFIADLEKLESKYGAVSSFYDFKKDNYKEASSFHVQGLHGVTNVLHRMVRENYGDTMLRYKSNELIKKLDLI
jgi:hypothetical protein